MITYYTSQTWLGVVEAVPIGSDIVRMTHYRQWPQRDTPSMSSTWETHAEMVKGLVEAGYWQIFNPIPPELMVSEGL